MINTLPTHNSKFDVTMIDFPSRISDTLNFVAVTCLSRIRYLRYGASLTIRSVNLSQMRNINWKYRNKSYPTNIISISADALPNDIECYRELGDIFICMPIIHQESKKYDKNFNEYMIRISVHGILHLVGYDHKNDDEEKRMLSKEAKLLSLFDIDKSILL